VRVQEYICIYVYIIYTPVYITGKSCDASEETFNIHHCPFAPFQNLSNRKDATRIHTYTSTLFLSHAYLECLTDRRSSQGFTKYDPSTPLSPAITTISTKKCATSFTGARVKHTAKYFSTTKNLHKESVFQKRFLRI